MEIMRYLDESGGCIYHLLPGSILVNGGHYRSQCEQNG